MQFFIHCNNVYDAFMINNLPKHQTPEDFKQTLQYSKAEIGASNLGIHLLHI